MPRRPIASRSWCLVLAAFVGSSLWPLFARCPPMQDYPQHLVLTQVLANIDDPASDYRRYFETHLGVVYSTFYVVTLGLAKVMSIQTAGRVTLGLYPLLVLVMVWRIQRRAEGGVEPWGAVLFFPLSFNQQYFLGNVNYLLALPLVILALLDYEEFLEGAPRRSVAIRQAVWPFLLVATHPFALVVFIALALVTSAWWRWCGSSPGLRLRASYVMCLSVLCLVVTYVATRGAHTEMTSASIEYLPPSATAEFLALVVNDMQGLAKPHVMALALWGALLSVFAAACVREWRSAPRVSRLYVCLIVTLAVAVFVVPFRVGPYTYLNMRCAAILYFLIALLAARTPFRTWWRASVVALAAGCMILSLAKQAQISRELARIAPIASAIPKHARVLPLVFDNDSTALDSRWFDIHLHAYLYYHLISGGGFSPYLPTTAMHPINYRPDERRPAPGEYRAAEFKWKTHAADYEYFLALNPPAELVPYLIAHGCELVTHSGPWLLFKRGVR